MALATGKGLALLHGIRLTTPAIATHCERGRRSGIGIAAFDDGGLIVDAGRKAQTGVPPVIARLSFPERWRFLILLDPTHQGIHGTAETEAFSTLPPFPQESAAMLCHELIMQGLPALLEDDIVTFGGVIHHLQKMVGDHFATAQGGRFTSPKVARALSILGECGAVGMGQSSWGPTGFCLTESEESAKVLLQTVNAREPGIADLDIRIVTPRRSGARITPLTHA
jgi:beta-RFAP synthase